VVCHKDDVTYVWEISRIITIQRPPVLVAKEGGYASLEDARDAGLAALRTQPGSCAMTISQDNGERRTVITAYLKRKNGMIEQRNTEAN
jgi:hypothetical protein